MTVIPMTDDPNADEAVRNAQAPASGFTLIPLSKLAISPQNIRRTDRKVDIDALAASIRSLGLLQNLSVTRDDGDRFTVVAGGRRLAALKALAKQGVLARDYPVPCLVLNDAAAVESSLAENVQRVATDAMDEVEAFAALNAQGHEPAAIAQRFGCTLRHVAQRLALAALSSKLKAAYRKGDLGLDAARAFCMEPDPARQEAVFKMLRKPVTHAQSVRAHLTQGRMRGTDRLARFVGIDAYEAAGGSLTRDLFLESEIYVEDPALMARLANDKLETFREDLLAKGWGWVNVNLGAGRFEGAAAQRLQPSRRQPTEEEAKVLAKLETDIEMLEAALEDADAADAQWTERDRLDAEHQALTEALLSWDPEEMALAGVVISVEHDGRLFFTFGIVAKADAGKLAKLRRRRDEATAKQLRIEARSQSATGVQVRGNEDPGASAETEPEAVEAPWEEPRATMPRSLTRDLTAIRTAVIRQRLIDTPNTGLAVGVFALLHHALTGSGAPGISLSARPRWLADRNGLEAGRTACLAGIPDTQAGLLEWCLGQETTVLIEALALLVASNVDLAHEDGHIDDRRKQALADQIARALDLDMTRHWTPDLAFWTRLPKAALIKALESAPCTLRLEGDDRAAFLRKMAKGTKDELARTVAQALEGKGWLPALLVTPEAEPRFEITDAGLSALKTRH